eukprot:6214550-Pleurochrysis_carterae.AAC.2
MELCVTAIHSDVSRLDYLGTLDRSPLVSHPPQFVLYVVSSIYSVSDTKPRSLHRADAQHARSATAVAVHHTVVSRNDLRFDALSSYISSTIHHPCRSIAVCSYGCHCVTVLFGRFIHDSTRLVVAASERV